MRTSIRSIIVLSALLTPTMAATYPVSGRWGQSTGNTQGAIDCTGKRVVTFSGNTRTDTGGGVPAYRNQSVTADGPSQYRIVDIFSSGQISAGHVTYTLRQIDDDNIELQMPGGTLRLQRCK